MEVTGFDYTPRFKRDLKSADPQLQHAVKSALKLLQENHRSVRAHALQGHKPRLFVMDVYSNHSWQVTFELVDGVAVLQRLGTHKTIDRAPK
jgi:mRNA-degrading endonuclease YafQ of YafQ-DinJ toxin-antitoxin module